MKILYPARYLFESLGAWVLMSKIVKRGGVAHGLRVKVSGFWMLMGVGRLIGSLGQWLMFCLCRFVIISFFNANL